MARVVLVTGVSGYLGAEVAGILRHEPGIERLIEVTGPGRGRGMACAGPAQPGPPPRDWPQEGHRTSGRGSRQARRADRPDRGPDQGHGRGHRRPPGSRHDARERRGARVDEGDQRHRHDAVAERMPAVCRPCESWWCAQVPRCTAPRPAIPRCSPRTWSHGPVMATRGTYLTSRGMCVALCGGGPTWPCPCCGSSTSSGSAWTRR